MVLDPITEGYHLTHVLMDGGSSLNLIYQDTVRKMGINPSRISQSNTAFEGVIPGVEAYGRGSVVLEVTFGSPGNSRSEELLFTSHPSRAAITIAWENGLHLLQRSTALRLPHTQDAWSTRRHPC